MLSRTFVVRSLIVSGFSLVSLFNSRIAFGDALATGAAASSEAGVIVSDGQPIDLQRLDAKIAPPQGWEVKFNSGGFSTVMQEKRVEPKAGEKVLFQRNITLAVIQRGSPIDEVRAQELSEELTKAISADSSASNFKILEHKFFNYHGSNDGLMLYSTVKLGEFDMMQMHVLVSNESKQYLMTYTDFADQFAKAGSVSDVAWKTMTSLQISGDAPQRYEGLLRYGSLAGGLLLLLIVFSFIRSRRAKTDYARDADEIYRDESPYLSDEGKAMKSTLATASNMWNLKSRRTLVDDEGREDDGGDWYVSDAVKLG